MEVLPAVRPGKSARRFTVRGCSAGCCASLPLRDKLAAVYTQQTGKTPKIEAIHAGLECGLFAGQLPGLDCVSFGPDLADIHTTREKMSISSVQRTWRFLLGALEALKD